MKKLEHIIGQDAPTAVGPYNHAVRYGDMVFTSGQIPLKPEDGNLVEGGVAEQTKQVIENL